MGRQTSRACFDAGAVGRVVAAAGLAALHAHAQMYPARADLQALLAADNRVGETPAFYPMATMCQIDPNVLSWSPVACVVFFDARSGVK